MITHPKHKNTQLQDELVLYDLPKFPPKKINLNIGTFLTLKENEVEGRRIELERFFKGCTDVYLA